MHITVVCFSISNEIVKLKENVKICLGEALILLKSWHVCHIFVYRFVLSNNYLCTNLVPEIFVLNSKRVFFHKESLLIFSIFIFSTLVNSGDETLY